MSECNEIMRKIMSDRSLRAVHRAKFGCETGTDSDGSFAFENMDSKYLRAVQESTLGCGFAEQASKSLESLPVPQIAPAEQRPFIKLVDQILKAKSADPNADTSELEESIDWLVYDLYDLTDEETAVIADYFWDGDMTQEEEDAVFVKMMEEELAKTDERVSVEEIRRILRA